MATDPLRLQLELAHDGDPIESLLRSEQDESFRFTGWLELIASSAPGWAGGRNATGVKPRVQKGAASYVHRSKQSERNSLARGNLE